MSGGDGEAIAGACVDLDDFSAQFILLLQDEPCEIGGVFEFGNDDAFDGDVEAFENVRDEIVGEGPFLGGISEEHTDDGAHVVFDLDNEDFIVITDEDGTPAIGGENSADRDRHNISVHGDSVWGEAEKTSLAVKFRNESVAGNVRGLDVVKAGGRK